jgi:hypothetical protein
MAQQVRDLVDRAPLSDELRSEAVTHQVCACDVWKLKAATFKSRSDYSGNDAAVVDGADRWDMLQEYTWTVALGPGMQHVFGERFARFL